MIIKESGLNIDPKNIIEIFESVNDSEKYTICYWTVKESPQGTKYRCKEWQDVPKADGMKLTEVLNKQKKDEEEFERRSGVVSPEVARSRIEQHERDLLGKVRGQEIFQGKPGGKR
jgi:hypothetical protein